MTGIWLLVAVPVGQLKAGNMFASKLASMCGARLETVLLLMRARLSQHVNAFE
jgi:hypothetical protein